MQQILRLFPLHMREDMEKSRIFHHHLEEIRVRVNEYLVFHTSEGNLYLKGGQLVKKPDPHCLIARPEDMEQICTFMSNYSLYAFEEEIRQGYLTVEGGHRIGVCGQVSCESGKIRRIFPILYLNIRIANEKIGCAGTIYPYLMENRLFLSTLIISEPGAGKTTLLRDLIRLLSDGRDEIPGKKVALVDERSEIAGCIRGIPQNHIGRNTDVLDACPKTEGMMLMVRTMSPEILAVDEIGNGQDLAAIEQASACGCRILASVHAESRIGLSGKPGWRESLKRGIFSRYVEIRMRNGKRLYSIYDIAGQRIFPVSDSGTDFDPDFDHQTDSSCLCRNGAVDD